MATLKQKFVASKLVENGGNIGKAMISAGYSPATAKTPQKLTQSKGWQELMATVFPDKLLLKKHKELLYAEQPAIIARALDMAYKIKGYYYHGSTSYTQVNSLNNLKITDEQLKRVLKG